MPDADMFSRAGPRRRVGLVWTQALAADPTVVRAQQGWSECWSELRRASWQQPARAMSAWTPRSAGGELSLARWDWPRSGFGHGSESTEAAADIRTSDGLALEEGRWPGKRSQ